MSLPSIDNQSRKSVAPTGGQLPVSSWLPLGGVWLGGTAGVVAMASAGSATMVTVFVVLSALACAIIGTTGLHTPRTEITPALLLPTFVSGFQNVYLAPFASAIPSNVLQVVIIWNVIYSIMLVIVLSIQRGPLRSGTDLIRECGGGIVIAGIVIYGAVLMALNGNAMAPAIASLRNLISPMLFLCLAFIAGPRVDFERYARAFLVLGGVVIAAGIVEYTNPTFWITLDLSTLWMKKGIDVQPSTGLPLNFYASEQLVPGEFIRRMAGPFADPVNFGTFLFCLFCVAWYLRSRLLKASSVVAIVLAVSKGGLLGLLVFLAVWSKKHRSTFEHVLAIILAVVVGVAFLEFSESNSTGSVDAHTGGLLAALVNLPSAPQGHGLGGTGVLSSLVSNDPSAVNKEITETGLGMVIGQLGIVGIGLYIYFFTGVVRMTTRVHDDRSGVVATTLVLAFLANCAFNEVALSPNSSAAYFIIIGLLVSRDYLALTPSLEGDSSAHHRLHV